MASTDFNQDGTMLTQQGTSNTLRKIDELQLLNKKKINEMRKQMEEEEKRKKDEEEARITTRDEEGLSETLFSPIINFSIIVRYLITI